MVLSAATAPVLVPVVFGTKWNAAIPLIQIFVLLGLFRALASTLGPLVLAKGRADLAFWLGLASAAIATVAFWFAAQHGLQIMAWVEVAVAAVLFATVMYIVKKLIALFERRYFLEYFWLFLGKEQQGGVAIAQDP